MFHNHENLSQRSGIKPSYDTGTNTAEETLRIARTMVTKATAAYHDGSSSVLGGEFTRSTQK